MLWHLVVLAFFLTGCGGAEPCAALSAALTGYCAGFQSVLSLKLSTSADIVVILRSPSTEAFCRSIRFDCSLLDSQTTTLPCARYTSGSAPALETTACHVAHYPVVPDDLARSPAGIPATPPELGACRAIILRLRLPPAGIARYCSGRYSCCKYTVACSCVRIFFKTPHLLDQPVLVRAVIALHAPLGLRRAGRDDFDPQLLASRPNCVTGSCPCSCSRCVGAHVIHVLPSAQRLRHSVLFDPRPQRVRRRARSSPLAQPQRHLLVASSVMFIRQPSDCSPAVVKTSSICTDLPRIRAYPSACGFRFRRHLHSPSANIHRRNVSPSIRIRLPSPNVQRCRSVDKSFSLFQRFSHPLHHPSAKPRRRSKWARTPRAAMPQPLGPLPRDTSTITFRLPVTHPIRLTPHPPP